MEAPQNHEGNNDTPQKQIVELKGSNKKKRSPKKGIKKGKASGKKKKIVNKVVNAQTEDVVKNPEIPQLAPIPQQQFLPVEMTNEHELPVKNLQQVNKEYQLKDIVNETKHTTNYLKSVNTTVVKPVIVQKVTTRKPIIAPVEMRTPVNFFEGQPLSTDDLVLQNFFKDTSPMVDATSKDLTNSYLFNGTTFQDPNAGQYNNYSNYNNFNFNDYNNYNNSNAFGNYTNYTNYSNYTNYTNYNDPNNLNNYFSQSVQYPSAAQYYPQTNTEPNTFTRPQVEKVHQKNISASEIKPQSGKKSIRKSGVKKIVKKKKVVKSQISAGQAPANNPQEKEPNVAANNNQKIAEQKAEDEDDKLPRDSMRPKK